MGYCSKIIIENIFFIEMTNIDRIWECWFPCRVISTDVSLKPLKTMNFTDGQNNQFFQIHLMSRVTEHIQCRWRF